MIDVSPVIEVQLLVWDKRCTQFDILLIGGARVHHPPTNTFGSSGDVKWHPESQHHSNISMYDITARIQGMGFVEGYSTW